MSGGEEGNNVAIAFALVTAAGLSTTIGAAMVFCESFVVLASKRVLAVSLGFSAGVMLYVSMVEIFTKSVKAFTNCNCLWEAKDPAKPGYIMATICFFGGILFTMMLDVCVHALSRRGGSQGLGHSFKHKNATEGGADIPQPHDDIKHLLEDGCCNPVKFQQTDLTSTSFAPPRQQPPKCAQDQCEKGCCPPPDPAEPVGESEDPVTWSRAVPDITAAVETKQDDDASNDDEMLIEDQKVEINVEKPRTEGTTQDVSVPVDSAAADSVGTDSKMLPKNAPQFAIDHDTKRLNHMGLMTALAIGLHNFPEGLATFVGALADPSVGAALAVAIAIHNIPEGLCVAIPIFYATGSRWRAFWMAFWSGVTEIIGAALGYAFLMAVLDDSAYGVLFGLVAGMMVGICTKELIPTALRYDEKYVPLSVFAGMGIMGLSLVLFSI